MTLLAFAMNTESTIMTKMFVKVWKKQNSLKIRSQKFKSQLRIAQKKGSKRDQLQRQQSYNNTVKTHRNVQQNAKKFFSFFFSSYFIQSRVFISVAYLTVVKLKEAPFQNHGHPSYKSFQFHQLYILYRITDFHHKESFRKNKKAMGKF